MSSIQSQLFDNPSPRGFAQLQEVPLCAPTEIDTALEKHAPTVLYGTLPMPLIPGVDSFERLWALHPEGYHEIQMHGRPVKTPRWQQAFGADYHYTGRVNKALPVNDLLQPFLSWAQAEFDDRLNGLLLNWYDAKLKHYIGKHRDSTKNMIPACPIVTVSFGAERTFRFRSWHGRGAPKRRPTVKDFAATHGSVIVIPYTTNQSWTHEVPLFRKNTGRRISLTIRGFRVD